ncbi:MAG: hypothetical protein ACRCXC_02510 [Legionella sp.]
MSKYVPLIKRLMIFWMYCISVSLNAASQDQNHSILSLLNLTPSTLYQDYVTNKKQFQLQSLITEQRHPKTYHLSYQIEKTHNKA